MRKQKKIKKEFVQLISKKGGNSKNWLETLNIVHEEAIDPNLNIDDDIKRELVFL